MSLHRLAPLMIAVLGSVSAAGCSGQQSPVAPDVARSAAAANFASGGSDAAPSAVAGEYDLRFVQGGQEVTTLQAGGDSELTLRAHVTADDALAQSGEVTFEYCAYKGRPNDVTQANEAPLAECESGAASWKRLGTARVVNGDAEYVFGTVQIPRTVGFRFRYAGRRSGIANGVSAPEDFTWY